MTIILVIAIIAISCYVSFWFGYKRALDYAADSLDRKFEEKFKDVGIVVKKDNRIIECNGMMIPMQCKKCRFGRVKENSVECFVPDYDGVPTMGLVRTTDTCKGEQNE